MAKSKRIDTFKVDAESVQGVEGATITSKSVKQRTWKLYGSDVDHGDSWLVEKHVIGWSGIVGDDEQSLPSPKDEPEIVGELYMYEVGEIAKLIVRGPNGPDSLKN